MTDPCYRGLVVDDSEGDRLAAAMGSNKILLHANHGVIVAGKSVAEAVDNLYYLERAAEVVVKSMMTGQQLESIPQDVIDTYQKQKYEAYTNELNDGQKEADDLVYHQVHFEGLKRKLTRGWDTELPLAFN